MPPNTNPIFELTVVSAGVQLTSTNTTDLQSVMTAGGNGTRIDGIFCSTDDTSAVNLAFYINDNGTDDWYIGNVLVPTGSGYTTVARVDALATLGIGSPKYLALTQNYSLKVACVATMTAGKTTTILVVGGDY